MEQCQEEATRMALESQTTAPIIKKKTKVVFKKAKDTNQVDDMSISSDLDEIKLSKNESKLYPIDLFPLDEALHQRFEALLNEPIVIPTKKLQGHTQKLQQNNDFLFVRTIKFVFFLFLKMGCPKSTFWPKFTK